MTSENQPDQESATNSDVPSAPSEFEQLSDEQMSLMGEFWLFIKEEKK